MGKEEMNINFWFESPKDRNHLGCLGVYGKYKILKMQDEKMYTDAN
jgi:hypothetical protein